MVVTVVCCLYLVIVVVCVLFSRESHSDHQKSKQKSSHKSESDSDNKHRRKRSRSRSRSRDQKGKTSTSGQPMTAMLLEERMKNKEERRWSCCNSSVMTLLHIDLVFNGNNLTDWILHCMCVNCTCDLWLESRSLLISTDV